MTQYLSQSSQPDRFPTTNWIAYELADGRWLWTLSGIAVVNFQGSGLGFRRDTFEIDLDTSGPKALRGDPPPGKYWVEHIEQWAPFATINSIGASGTENGGFAVDVVLAPGLGILFVDVAVRDRNAQIWRIGYHATWIFQLEALDIPG